MSDSFEKFLGRFTCDRSPYEVMRIFEDIFSDGNTFALEQKYGITKYDIRMIRQFPEECVLYVLAIQEQLGVYYADNFNNVPAVNAQVLSLKNNL